MQKLITAKPGRSYVDGDEQLDRPNSKSFSMHVLDKIFDLSKHNQPE